MKPLVIAVARALFGLRQPSKADNARTLRARGETAASLRIRDATPADVPALAELHVVTWNATYGPLGMRGPGVAVREAQWREAFANDDGRWFCLVAERATGELVGFAKGTPSDHPGFDGELNKIYVLREYQRLGLGRRLVGHVVRRFLARGVASMWLSADPRNPSCRFYEALGAERLLDERGEFHGGYGWRDLRALAARCPAD